MRERIRNRNTNTTNNGTTSRDPNNNTTESNKFVEDHNNRTTVIPSESTLPQHQQHHPNNIMKSKNQKVVPTNKRSFKRKIVFHSSSKSNEPMISIGRPCIICVLCILSLIAILAPNLVLVNQYSTEYWNTVSISSTGNTMERRSYRYNGSRMNYPLLDKKRMKNRVSKRRGRTTPPPVSVFSQGYKFEPELVANLPIVSGPALPKCNPGNPYRILITGILSSTLSMGLALSLALQYQNLNCMTIFGIDSLLPNSLQSRWEYMDRLEILKRHNIPSKLFVPFSGVFPLGVTEEAFRGELDKAQLTHIIHVTREDVDVSQYRETSQSLLSMEQILEYLKGGKGKRIKFVYVSHSEGEKDRYKALKKADEVLASTYYSLHGVSSVGVRLPSVFGPWGVARDDILYQLAYDLVRNSTLPNPPAPQDDRQLTLMSVNDAAHAVFISMQHTTPGAIVFNTPKGSENIYLSSLHEQMQQVWDSSPSDYTTMSKLQKSLYQAIGSKYYQVYPHGPAPYDKNFARNLWKSALPVQYPCASECSHTGYCEESHLDPLLPLLHKATARCKYVLYTDNFDEELEDLTDVQEITSGDSSFCYVIFLHQNAPFLQNTTSSLKALPLLQGWITVALPKQALTFSTSLLIKLSPSKLFSPSVQKAMFFHTKSPPPLYVLEQIFDQMQTPYVPARKKWKRASDGTRVLTPIQEEPPRHIVFMSSHYSVADDDKMLQVMDQIRAVRYSEEEQNLDKVGQRQFQFYEMVQNLLNEKLLRAPTPVEVMQKLRARGVMQPILFPLSFIRSTWMVHDFNYGKAFRCDAYHEQLFWGYDHLEDWSLMYTYAKWFGKGLLGEVEGEEFGPLNGKDHDGVGLYLRVLKKPIKIRS